MKLLIESYQNYCYYIFVVLFATQRYFAVRSLAYKNVENTMIKLQAECERSTLSAMFGWPDEERPVFYCRENIKR